MYPGDEESKWPRELLTDARVEHRWDEPKTAGRWFLTNLQSLRPPRDGRSDCRFVRNHRPAVFGSSHRCSTRASVSSSRGHFDSSSPGYIRNQITNTRTSASGFFASSSLCAHRAPDTHVGHVGDSSKTRRG